MSFQNINIAPPILNIVHIEPLPLAPINIPIENKAEEEKVGVVCFSKEHAQQLAQIYWDEQFLKEVLNLIKSSYDKPNLKKFLKHPILITRFNAFNSRNIDSCRDVLVEFIYKNQSLLKEPFIQNFVAGQLVCLQASIDLKDLCYKSRSYLSHEIDAIKQKILCIPSLPKVLLEPLKSIQSSRDQEISIPKSFVSSQPNLNLSISSYYAGQDTKRLAVEVATEIDGFELRTDGLRLWIHQPPKGKGDRACDLIMKDIQEFQSGRRHFIFKTTEGSVPLQNYKEVMLYIIYSLKKDREDFYQKDPNYIDPKVYEECVAELEQKKYGSIHFDDKYPFEWAARHIVELENEVTAAHSDVEISLCLKKFNDYYYHLPNFNMDLTVCSCIDHRGLNPSSIYKPVIHHGIPLSLINLAKSMGVYGDFSKEMVLSVFSELSTYHPQSVQTTFVELKKLYTQLVKDSKNKDLMRQFLQKWASMPYKEKFFAMERGKESPSVIQSLVDFVKDLEMQLGVSRGEFEELLKNCDASAFPLIAKLQKTNQVNFDPEYVFISLKELAKEAKQFKSEHAKEISKQDHWDVFLEDLNYLLNTTPPELIMKEYDLDFNSLKKLATGIIQLPLPGIGEKVEIFRKSLFETHATSLIHTQIVFESLLDLKTFILKERLFGEAFVSHETLKALNLIAKIECKIAEEVLKETNPTSPEALQLITRIAVAHGFLDKEIQDLAQLKDALKSQRDQRMQGYTQLRRQIINSSSSSLLKLLNKHAYTVDDAVQIIQGGLNTGMAAILDKLVTFESEKSSLLGLPTQAADVIGKVRFVSNNEEFIEAKEGEILVIENVSSEVHKYAKAAAVIARQGGIFSHAAITFSEMHIPALLGCDIDALKNYEGQFMHLHLSEECAINPIPKEIIKTLEKIAQPTLETAGEIELLPDGIREIASMQFYKAVFERFSPNEIASFISFAGAKAYFAKEKEAIQDFKKRLWKAENPVEDTYLMNKIEKKLNRLLAIAKEADASIADELQKEILEFNRRISENCSISALNRAPVISLRGKKENLDFMKEYLSKDSANDLFDIPFYSDIKAQDSIWSRNVEHKEEAVKVLRSTLSNFEKSERISKLISQLHIDQGILDQVSKIEGDLIVRSSAKIEDQAESAAAGIFSSLPVKDKEDPTKAILEVISSSFSERALAFFAARGFKDVTLLFEMSLIVQKYIVDAEFSGVAFSVADEKKWDVAGMQLVKGLGGGVDGTQTPTYVFVDTKDNTLADVRLKKGEKLPCEIPIVKEITALLKKLETKLNVPVEIEFVGKEGKISIVQMRPITRFR